MEPYVALQTDYHHPTWWSCCALVVEGSISVYMEQEGEGAKVGISYAVAKLERLDYSIKCSSGREREGG